MTTSVTLNPAVTNVTVASPSAISVDLTTSTTTVNVTSGLLPQNLGTDAIPSFLGLNITSIAGINFSSSLSSDSGRINFEDNKSNGLVFSSLENGSLVAYQTFDSTDGAEKVKFHKDVEVEGIVTAEEFVGDLRGAVRFQAKAGEALTKGDVVYISSVSGQKPIVSKAQANSAATMPSFGLANATVASNGNLEVISFGTFAHGDTSGGDENWAFGDILYVSAATAGALTKVKPAGAANLIQNVGKVERVHESTGSIMVAGAGRTAATPNLDNGKFFIGDSNNYSTVGSFNNQFTNTSGTISLNAANTISVALQDGNLSPTEYLALAGKRIIQSGSTAPTYTLFQPVAADVGKSWIICNPSNQNITIDPDTQNVWILDGVTLAANESSWRIKKGGVAEIVCIASHATGGTTSNANFVIFGAGIIEL